MLPNEWKVRSTGETIYLLTPEDFKKLPNGTTVISISGDRKVKGRDYIDDDTRFGHLAFGLPMKGD